MTPRPSHPRLASVDQTIHSPTLTWPKTCRMEIHQPVRHLKKDGEYFVCTDFRKPGSKDEYYDIDFWVNQKSGKLEVDNVKIHKVPVQEDGVWTQVPRYTFEGMDFDVTN